MKPILVKNYVGLGDQVYTRPFVIELAKERTVYVPTTFPQLYDGVENVLCVPRESAMRTHKLNLARYQGKLHKWPTGVEEINPEYGPGLVRGLSFLEALAESFGIPLENVEPHFGQERKTGTPSRVLIVRPPTIRREWPATMRNPLPEIFMKVLRATRGHYYRCAVGTCAVGEEWLDRGIFKDWEMHFLCGELTLEQLIDLVASSAAVLCTPSMIVPLALALKVPMFCVFGGMYSPRDLMFGFDARNAHALAPKRFCRCFQLTGGKNHHCPKWIKESSIGSFIEDVLACSIGARTTA